MKRSTKQAAKPIEQNVRAHVRIVRKRRSMKEVMLLATMLRRDLTNALEAVDAILGNDPKGGGQA